MIEFGVYIVYDLCIYFHHRATYHSEQKYAYTGVIELSVYRSDRNRYIYKEIALG